MTIHKNFDDNDVERVCDENKIWEIKPKRERQKALMQLFQTEVNFACVPFIDDTVTSVSLCTKPPQTDDAIGNRSGRYLRNPSGNFQCDIKEDTTSAVWFKTAEFYRQRYPSIPSIRYEELVKAGEKYRRLSPNRGVYKVLYGNEYFVFKEAIDPEDEESLDNEIAGLVLVQDSPHVINLLGLVVSKPPYATMPTASHPRIVRGILIQYATRGELHDILTNNTVDIPWSQRLRWAIQITKGLQDIHAVNMAHHDLKCQNVVITNHGNAVIIDIARVGTTYGWRASEYYVDVDLEDPTPFPLIFLQKADIYSLGVVLWEICTRKPVDIPIGTKHEEFFIVSEGTAPESYVSVMEQCMCKSPDERPALAEIRLALERLVDVGNGIH